MQKQGNKQNQRGKDSAQQGSQKVEDRKTASTGKHAEPQDTDNDHQKTVQGKNQRGPADKVGRDAGGNEGSKGQNARGGGSGSAGANGPSVGSHKPGGDGPGTKKFKHETDDNKRNRNR
ncbi:MAG TPA: hypothetical protein VES67_22050 [Vicinamibacterales bacterium]|nr:hypothetical protein [Vicinamibacterales bacterium]